MDLLEFQEEIKERMLSRFGEQVCIRFEKVKKNNGVILDRMTIMEPGKSIAPYIYLNYYYELYIRKNKSMEEIVGEITEKYEEKNLNIQFDIDSFLNYEKIKGYVRGRLVNTEMNKELLSEVPHRDFLDLSILYYLDVQGFGEHMASIRIDNQHLKIWKIVEGDLFLQMQENMKIRDDGHLIGLHELICSELNIKDSDLLSIPENMYVLTNAERMYGSIEILNQHLLKEAGSLLGSSFYLLPSSVHESILVRGNKNMNPEELATMVSEINNSVVEIEDILSYHVYYYDGLEGTISIAA